MIITTGDLYLIKDKCLQYYNEVKWGPKRPDERMLLVHCYTLAIVDYLKAKGLSSDIKVEGLDEK